jgi:tRNA threonylcarbamoyladenosine biosynthesis protein TsaE
MTLASADLKLTTASPEETRRLADQIGRRLPSGSLVLLRGDLGSGKTVFAQGLARGLEVPADYAVTSPTYTLVNEYPGRLPLFHVDLYRLPDGGADLESLGLAESMGHAGVILIEWPDRLLPGELPLELMEVRLVAGTPGRRRITLIGYGLPYVDLIKKLDFSTE